MGETGAPLEETGSPLEETEAPLRETVPPLEETHCLSFMGKGIPHFVYHLGMIDLTTVKIHQLNVHCKQALRKPDF